MKVVKKKTEKDKHLDFILKKISPYITSKKAKEELKEHWSINNYLFKRTVLPIIFFYLLFGLVLNINIFDSLFLSLLIFVYSNFLPDIDIFFVKTEKRNLESLWYEKYTLLFIAPVVLYYLLARKARPYHSILERPFHNFFTVLVWGSFLLLMSSIFWRNTLERISLPLFGVIGFSFHLIVDKYYNKIKTSILKSR